MISVRPDLWSETGFLWVTWWCPDVPVGAEPNVCYLHCYCTVIVRLLYGYYGGVHRCVRSLSLALSTQVMSAINIGNKRDSLWVLFPQLQPAVAFYAVGLCTTGTYTPHSLNLINYPSISFSSFPLKPLFFFSPQSYTLVYKPHKTVPVQQCLASIHHNCQRI